MLPREQFNKFYYFHYYTGPIFLSVRCVFALSLRRPTCALGATMPPSHGQSADLARNWSDFDCRLAHSTEKQNQKRQTKCCPTQKIMHTKYSSSFSATLPCFPKLGLCWDSRLPPETKNGQKQLPAKKETRWRGGVGGKEKQTTHTTQQQQQEQQKSPSKSVQPPNDD